MRQSFEHVPALQITPDPQLAPLARVVHADVLVAGWHDWHELLGFATPDP
jgi:hypothetical protein